MTKRPFTNLTAKIGSMIVLIEIVALALFGFFFTKRVSDVLDRKDEANVLEIGAFWSFENSSATTQSPPNDNAQPLDTDIQPPDDGAQGQDGGGPGRNDDDREVYIINADGSIMSRNPAEDGATVADVPDIDATLLDFDNPQEVLKHWMAHGDHFVTGVTPVFADDGTFSAFVYTILNTNDTQSTKVELARTFLVGSIVTVLLTSLILFVGIRLTVLRRIMQVLGVLQQVEAGELTARLEDNQPWPDEMAMLQQGVNATIARLETLVNTLEQQVTDRTRDVKIAADVARRITTILDLDELLHQIVEQVNTHFALYVSFIYLGADAARLQYATGANAEGKFINLDQNHATALTTRRIINQAATTCQPVIVNRLEETGEYQPFPTFPLARAEAAFPIVQGNQLLGVFNVQSTQPGHFGTAEVGILSTLSEQIATAISNAQSYLEAENARYTAEAANRAKSAFLANMSHELRTPLNAIIGFSQLMARTPEVTPEHQANLAVINRSGEHLLQLINDVLEMAKIEVGRTDLNIEAFDVYHMLANIEEMLSLQAEKKGLRLGFERAADVPQYIATDESKLRQILINLIGNAIKFTDEGEAIVRIGYEPDAETPRLRFEIEDTGYGIAEDEYDHLFEIFTQTASGKHTQEGTGLGLPLSRQFVRMMGGDIEVTSTLGQGSIFSFTIQIDLADAEAIQRAEQDRTVLSLAPGQPTYRILIVEDKWENRALLRKLLEPLGFSVREAVDGQEGVEIAAKWNPHLIFMDMRMPVMNGYEATQQIKATTQGQAIAIIALTASVFEHERAHILSIGCDAFVRKPFRQSELFGALEQHLGVEFIYADEDALVAASVPTIVLTPEVLRALPEAWRAELGQAAAAARYEKARELIRQIETDHPAIAQSLKAVVDNFDFKTIAQLTGDQHET